MNFIFSRQKKIFYSLAALVHKILFLPLENKIHIFALPCNISHEILSIREVKTRIQKASMQYSIYYVKNTNENDCSAFPKISEQFPKTF